VAAIRRRRAAGWHAGRIRSAAPHLDITPVRAAPASLRLHVLAFACSLSKNSGSVAQRHCHRHQVPPPPPAPRHSARSHLALKSTGFLKGIGKWFFRNAFNALENHILVKTSPNCIRQILLDSLWVDLQYKNIACQICNTFLCSFI
jgi:hypothetical protein